MDRQQVLLPLKADSAQVKLVAETFFVGGLKKAGTKGTMHLDRSTDDTLSLFFMK